VCWVKRESHECVFGEERVTCALCWVKRESHANVLGEERVTCACVG